MTWHGQGTELELTGPATLIARGWPDGHLYRFEGALKELPGAVFRSVTALMSAAKDVASMSRNAVIGEGSAFAAEERRERTQHRVDNRDGGHPELATAFLQRLAQRVVDQGVKDDSGIGLHSGDDPLKLGCGAHHAPIVLDCLRLIKLHQARARHRMDGVARRIRDEMKMKPRQHGIRPFLICLSTRPVHET